MRSLRPNGSKSFKTLNRGPIRNTTEILDPHSFACQSAATSRTDPTSAPACAVLSRPGTGVHEPSLSLAASFASRTRLPIICGQPLPQMDRSFRVPMPTARTPPTLRLAAEGSIIARSLHSRPQRLAGWPCGQGIAAKQPASLAGQRPPATCRNVRPRCEMCGRKFRQPKCAEKAQMCGPHIWADPNFQSKARSQHISTSVQTCRGRNIQSKVWPDSAVALARLLLSWSKRLPRR